MNQIERNKLISEFEILEGISSHMFDEKDWSRFDRFAGHTGSCKPTEQQTAQEKLKILQKKIDKVEITD